MSNKVYEIITNKIIEYLEQGVIPWKKPWKYATPQNMIRQKPYRGINTFILRTESAMKGFKSPFWLTFNEVKKLGGSVKKGEHSTMITFWKIKEYQVEIETDELDQNGKPITEEKTKRTPILRYYRVFNLDQTIGIPEKKIPKLELKEHEPIKEAETIINNMQNVPDIIHTDTGAWYSPTKDRVNVPDKSRFDYVEGYYSAMFHELGHSTGHQSRLSRYNGNANETMFGSESYSKEELIAEMCASFLCGETGIENETLENSAGYIQNWLEKLKNDKKLVMIASGQAQKASDYILGNLQVNTYSTSNYPFAMWIERLERNL